MSMSPWCVDRSMARAAERCQVVERGDAIVTARASTASSLKKRMRMRGLEPPRGFPHTALNRARLPIPPHPREAEPNSSRVPRDLISGRSRALPERSPRCEPTSSHFLLELRPKADSRRRLHGVSPTRP